jgi:CBS domain-containing protein
MSSMTTSTASLLVGFLDVCNKSLARNRESFPYKQLFGLYEKLFAGRNLGVILFEDDPKNEIGHVNVRYTGGRYEPIGGEIDEASFRVKLKRSYMEKVVGNPAEYIEHPEKLDWDWLKSRVGLEEDNPSETIQEIMTQSLRPIPQDASVQQASEMMRKYDVGALPVIDGQTLIGMVTDRDITVRATAEGADPRTTIVRHIMTPTVASCGEDADVEEAARVMRELRIRRLVVLDKAEHPVGVLSVGDIAARTKNATLAGAVLAEVSAR